MTCGAMVVSVRPGPRENADWAIMPRGEGKGGHAGETEERVFEGRFVSLWGERQVGGRK